MTQPPLEVKKSNPWKITTVLLLIAILGMGAVIGILWTGQTKQSEKQSEYTRVQVFSDSSAHAILNNYTYDFYYKAYGSTAQYPIEIDVSGVSKYLQATQGQTYNVLGIEVVVSQVHDDYIILLVKSL